jgi:hypothetical protein
VSCIADCAVPAHTTLSEKTVVNRNGIKQRNAERPLSSCNCRKSLYVELPASRQETQSSKEVPNDPAEKHRVDVAL